MTDSRRHPDTGQLEGFMAGSLSPAEKRRVLAHLLTDCAQCRQVTAPFAPFGLDDGDRVQKPTTEDPRSSEASPSHTADLLNVLRRGQEERDAEREQARDLLSELEGQPHPRRLLLARNSTRLRTWALVELLLEETFAARFDDPRRMRELAETALEIAERLDTDRYGGALVNDLRARASAIYGNALRITSRLAEAERRLARAAEILKEGTGDPLEEARVADLFASLRNRQRRLEEAVELQQKALNLYRRSGDLRLTGKALIDLASYLSKSGETNRAIVLARRSLEILDEEQEPRLVVAARHNLIELLRQSGELREALHLIDETRDLHLRLGDRRNVLRLGWLEGKLAHALGDTGRAIDALRDVCHGFAELELPLDAAGCALELVLLLLEDGRTAEVKPFVLYVETVFRVLDVERDVLAAWLLLRRAAEQEGVTRAVVDRVSNRLKQLEGRDGS